MTPSPTPRPLSAIEKLTPASDGNYYHTVSSGEYLAWIANLYEISLNELLNWNGLTSNYIIRPGQQLLLRITPPSTATPTPVPPSVTPSITPTPMVTATSQAIATLLPSLTVATEPDDSGSLSVGTLLVGILIVIGLFMLGWRILRN